MRHGISSCDDITGSGGGSAVASTSKLAGASWPQATDADRVVTRSLASLAVTAQGTGTKALVRTVCPAASVYQLPSTSCQKRYARRSQVARTQQVVLLLGRWRLRCDWAGSTDVRVGPLGRPPVLGSGYVPAGPSAPCAPIRSLAVDNPPNLPLRMLLGRCWASLTGLSASHCLLCAGRIAPLQDSSKAPGVPAGQQASMPACQQHQGPRPEFGVRHVVIWPLSCRPEL